MSNYTKTVDFAAKDSLPSGDSGKIIKGTEFETEFDNIATAIATKSDSAGPTFTGVLTFASLKGTGATTVTTILDEDDMSTDSATALATQQSIKAYVDAQQDTVDTLAEILALSNTTGGTDLAVSAGDDITFTDTSKAIFGDDSDLQIYHSGASSIIEDTGTGDLVIRGTDLYLRNASNSNRLYAGTDTRLYYDGDEKLATTNTGIDVTGTVVSDGLTVDTDTLVVDATNNRVGIGTSSPQQVLQISQGANATSTTLRIENTDTTIDAAQTANAIEFYTNDSSTGGTGVTGKISHVAINAGSTYGLAFSAYNGSSLSERMRIDEDGNVGIGTTSPATLLELSANNNGAVSNNTLRFTDEDGATEANQQIGKIEFKSNDSSGDGALVRSYILSASEDTTPSSYISFGTNPGGAGNTTDERMRIDSNGNVLVAKTAANNTDTGVTIYGGTSASVSIVRSGASQLILNRLSTDGDMAVFRKDGTTVGSIGTAGGEFFIAHDGTTDSGLRFRGSGEIIPASSGGAGTNAVSDLGSAGFRFKDLYLSGGVYLGGTAAANKLDDYEEGTWTVTLYDAVTGGNASPTTRTGYYTKIGNQVTAYFRSMTDIDTTGMTASNNMYVSLPFASGSEGSASGGAILDRVTYPTNYTQVNSYVPVNVSRGSFRMSGSTVGDTDVDVEDFNGSTSDIQSFTLTYFV